MKRRWEWPLISKHNDRDNVLRHALRSGTAQLHDQLDSALGYEAVSDDRAYAHFLSVQHAARAPIEAWARQYMAAEFCPPSQVLNIERDLAALGHTPPPPARFLMPKGADPIGLAWAIAGSSLGNRALLTRRRKTGLAGPDTFLSDTAMTQFFAALKPALETPVSPAEAKAAIAGATAVFATFLSALEPIGAAA